MKKNLFTTLLLFTTFLSFGQSFEGTITYVTDFEVSDKLIKMGMTKAMLLDKMKTEGTWADTIKSSYKQGNYYNLMNSQDKSWSIYKSETNKIYTMQEGEASDMCTVTDASIDLEFKMNGTMPTVEKIDTTVIVNGVPCSLVRVKWKMGTYDYYYNSSQLKVDPTLFAKHTYDGWAAFLKISNALPYKIVKSTKGLMSVTVTLVASKAEPIDDKLFSVPKLVPHKDFEAFKTGNSEIMKIKK